MACNRNRLLFWTLIVSCVVALSISIQRSAESHDDSLRRRDDSLTGRLKGAKYLALTTDAEAGVFANVYFEKSPPMNRTSSWSQLVAQDRLNYAERWLESVRESGSVTAEVLEKGRQRLKSLRADASIDKDVAKPTLSGEIVSLDDDYIEFQTGNGTVIFPCRSVACWYIHRVKKDDE